ncbi:DNA cytosine methyltransferase [Sphingobium sp. MI1205]|uniref:DNA cytosine methyltransferase n=1 Tax=Sphingobium sp. MI1205 TaxID=407020 RepID=UPI0007703BA0|nr:DNA cytosine methyltransferase [Sphingobium sp. MI1205]AMK18722.1 C-5 cytosine-specific DNA methylase [Sphingobium sp. MI1205]
MKTVSLLDDARAPLERDWSVGINVDNFAGGGGASTGLEQAGIEVHVAINHDPEAVAMHAANHPRTRHHCQSVWSVDPLEAVTWADDDGVVRAHPVRGAWFSPDCKHFSKAKGGKPVEKNIRDLAWVVHHWIDRLGPALRPAIIWLENVEEFRTWGPLGDDGRPCPARKGKTFNQWVAKLRRAGYRVQWKELRACDYGAPTSRKRLFLKARCDGRKISWPKPTHGKPGSPAVVSGKLLPWRTAAEIIDWSIPCPSIFERARPLKDATCRRIAAGIMRYVINAPHPFIVPVCNSSWAAGRAYAGDEPLRTITTAKGGEFAVVAPYFARTAHGDVDRNGKRRGRGTHGIDEPYPTVTVSGDSALIVPHVMTMRNSGKPHTAADEPTHTVTAGGAHQYLVAAFMAQHNGGVVGRDAAAPLSTITHRGTQQQLVASHIVKLRGTSKDGQPTDTPLHTVSAGGLHHAEVRAFLVKYYGNEHDGHGLDAPLGAVTTKDRFGLVTVTIAGEEYAIVDIGMRMLSPRELFLAQGFPADYIIELEVNGRPLTKTAQVRMCGNSVSPVMARALASVDFANDDDATTRIAA